MWCKNLGSLIGLQEMLLMQKISFSGLPYFVSDAKSLAVLLDHSKLLLKQKKLAVYWTTMLNQAILLDYHYSYVQS